MGKARDRNGFVLAGTKLSHRPGRSPAVIVKTNGLPRALSGVNTTLTYTQAGSQHSGNREGRVSKENSNTIVHVGKHVVQTLNFGHLDEREFF